VKNWSRSWRNSPGATELRSVTPDGTSKDHFVIIDAVGLEPEKMQDVQPLEKKRNVSLDKLFGLVTFGNREPDVLSSIASRLSRLDRRLTPNDRTALNDAAQEQWRLLSIRILSVYPPFNERSRQFGRSASSVIQYVSNILRMIPERQTGLAHLQLG
jgi:hypothetical protein